MAEDKKTKLRLEIAHILFIDIVGYSRLRTAEQSARIQKLQEIVRNTEQFRIADAEGKLLRLPTGDGGALVFRSLEAPVLCAVEIAKALRDHPDIRVRMGIHSGPVNEVTDLNEQANIAGAGINLAQRVMDCGDAGHILVSKHAAEDLEQYDQWHPSLHDLGEFEIKHGDRVQVVNFYNHDVGNSALPSKLATHEESATAATPQSNRRRYGIAALIAVIIVISAIAVFFKFGRNQAGSAAAIGLVPEKSIAVLPFENLSDDKSNAYFSEGIQDEILTRLSKIAALKVISRTSTQKYKSAPDNLREIGKQLGVANLLEGSVQKVANAVHVNVQLIRAATDEHLWAESYNRKLDDVFGVEGEVASAIADQLKAKLSGAEQKAVAERPTQNAAAYDAYLRGVSLETVGMNSHDAQQVAAFFAQAVQLDPNFALAWARLALTQSYLYFNGIEPSINSGAAVKAAADRAMVLQPDLGEAWAAQAVYRYRVLRDFPGALQSYQEALKRLPNSALVFEQIGHVERRLGQGEAAQKHYQMAAQLDPRNLKLLFLVADVLVSARRFDEADAIYDRSLQVSPGNETAYANKALNFQSQGKLSEAAKELSKIDPHSRDDQVVLARYLQFFFERKFNDAIALLTTPPSPPIAEDSRTITGLGFCQLYAGRTNDARATFQRAIATMKPSPDATVPIDARMLPSFLAWCYAGLGEKEKAVELARQAVADYQDDVLARPFTQQVLAQVQAYFGDLDSALAALPHLLEMPNGVTVGDLRVDPFWDPLRKDPRFEKLIR
jgi:TolB-like protein/Tfp pilus assembly protein PilF/class 3 adenylate cyclase